MNYRIHPSKLHQALICEITEQTIIFLKTIQVKHKFNACTNTAL
ncbi:hypothetical protein CRENPOLYSF2_2470001 [Crenothrix polyspora]|uniref:Uncharacterized protein n=1 Tax=Crenothrix polyspora TaxID=360316 RepID=A0A1R4H707_9GAMM|nr:hypothetical protein CRENPOLYSF2_2470001 [Crenothrix polyspora]